MNKEYFDVIIIGGGASGMMAAISCKIHHPNFSVVILDRTFSLGRKLLVSGAGRCNVTNINLKKSIENRYYGASPDFIHSVFEQFNFEDIIKFFNDLGIELYTERKTDIGKVFPVTDQAKTVNDLLLDELERHNVSIFLNTDCKKVEKKDGKFLIYTKQGDERYEGLKDKYFESKYLILSAGGKTYPALGASGSGYELAKSFGHTIIDPVPSALPLEGKNPMSQDLAGTKMEIEVTSIIDGKEVKKRSDDIMFVKYGFSGPAIFNISREFSIYFNREHKKDAWIKMNFFPGKNDDEVKNIMEERWNKRPEQNVEMSMYGFLPPKVPAAILREAKVENKKNKELLEKDKEKILNVLTNHKVKITGTLDWNQAEFTAGGIDSNEIEKGTLKSKNCENLYFCGEIIDVDGDVGGFNLSWAWSSGFVPGKVL